MNPTTPNKPPQPSLAELQAIYLRAIILGTHQLDDTEERSTCDDG